MKKDVSPNNEKFVSRNTLPGVSPLSRARKGRAIEAGKIAEIFSEIEKYLTQGFVAEAEERCFEVLENYKNSIDTQAQLSQFISLSLEMRGRFEEAAEILKPFEDKEITKILQAEVYTTLLLRQGISYSNLNNSSKAISLLTLAQRIAEDRDFISLLANIHLAFARVYRALSEFPVSRSYVDKAIKYAQKSGNWRTFAEACQVSASGYHQEGNSQKAIELFRQAIKTIGDRSAPFLLGKIYSDVSVVYWALFLSQDGIDSAKKAIALLEKTGNKYQTAIAYNNLGTNFLLSGDWKKAEQVFNRAIDLAFEIDHAHLSSFICSMGELNLLRGDFEEAEKLFTQSLKLSEQNKREWYSVQILHYLTRCLLAQNKTSSAIKKAEETIRRCEQINENHFKHLTSLVLAESYFKQKKTREAEEVLYKIEETEPENHALQGCVARVRGLIALESKDQELAVHHFSRSLSIFEKIGDLYHFALANYKLGQTLSNSQPDKANKYLTSAIEIFRQLKIESKLKLAEESLAQLKTQQIVVSRGQSANSHLLMLRLIESIASREILFCELAAVLQQEGKAQKLILAEVKGERNFIAPVVNNFSDLESNNLLAKLAVAQSNNDLDNFTKDNNLSIFQLRAPNALPAILIISPASGATLADGSSIQPLLRVAELGMEVCALRENNKEIPTLEDTNSPIPHKLIPNFIYSSPAMLNLVGEIQKIRTSDVTTLITGESGTGKELIARAIHLVSKRKDKVFVPFNCTAVPRELTEGHLFGYKKGAFTGAVADSPGIIRGASGGTLFLDEIGDLGLDVQPKILRFLQEGEVQPLGEKSPKTVDVRIIAATNMDLEEKVKQGLFREDLYYRLNVIRLSVPPLRERRSEIPELVKYYLAHYSTKFGRKNLTISSEAMNLLVSFNWQGNIRQLINEIQRMVARADSGDTIGPLHISAELKTKNETENINAQGDVQIFDLTNGALSVQTHGKSLEEVVTALEIQLISDSLKRNNDNISRVAKELGLTRRGLYLKLYRYGLKEDENEK